MSQPDIPKPRVGAVIGRYALALGSVAVALMITVLLHTDGLITPLFFLAIIISAWFGGMGPGMLAALVSTIFIDYFFLPPINTLKFDPAHIPQLLVFFISAVLVSSWSAVRKRAEILLRRARDEQEAKVQERTGDLKEANVKLQAEITERERVEEMLRQRADLLDLTHDTIFARDMNDVITYWNRGAEELYGWKKVEAIGKVTHELTQTVFPAPLEEINETLLRTDRWEGELIHTKRDGSKVVVASRWSLQRDERGRPLAILETNNDNTERRRAEEALRESERRYRYIFDAAGVSIWEEDFSQVKAAIDELKATGIDNFSEYVATHPELVKKTVPLVKVIDVNSATVKLFNANSKAELLVSLEKVFLPETEEVFAGELIALAEGRTSFESETVLQTVNGHRLTVLFGITFPTQPAKLDSVLVTMMDITERKRAEEELQKTQAELAHVARVTTMGELTSSIAHEVNQPLAAIVTNGNACLRWLSNDPPNVEEARQTVTRMVKDGHRASEVVGRIRAFFRKTAPERVRVDINQLIEDVIAMVSSELRRNRVRVRTELPDDLPRVLCDQIQLQQVLLNLLINAIEAMSAVSGPRELLIMSRRDETGNVSVAVQDTGMGFDEQNAAQLFNAFFTTKSQGLGMGLSISRTTIEAYGGRLWATRNDAGGATFQFTLPTTNGTG